MSIRVSRGVLRNTVAIVGLAAVAASLSGCSAGLGGFAPDKTTTSSIGQAGASNLSQPMPTLQPVATPAVQRVAVGPYVPPADIGVGGTTQSYASPMTSPIVPSGSMPSVTSNDLPALTSSRNGNPAMPAQSNLAPVTVAPKQQGMPIPIVDSSQPRLAVVSTSPSTPAAINDPNAYRHTIESGESLYTIARRYDVTAQAIVEANGFTSPDKIYVGQKIIIPGRPDLLAAKGPSAAPATQVAVVGDEPTAAPVVTPVAPPTTTAAIANPDLLKSNTPPVVEAAPAPSPTQVAAAQQPQASGATKFRWPVSGKVIVDFASSKGTGINVEAPEGSAVRAAENGTVIYVGSGVEGYGNLVLIRHANGYVSAYAHLKEISVTKGANISRGDNIGAVGMTGSVSRPQLHFELRMGATPVDPMPLLAS
jgi:murein DD-endopeptidase MepM/ murein hydrolase activator NlpD